MTTTSRFRSWFDAHHELPFFAWVHYADPAGSDHERGLARVDAALSEIYGLLEERDLLDTTLVVVTGTYGVPGTGEAALHDPAVRVPIAIRAPGVRVDVPVVEAQVRLMDLAPTVLDYLRLDVLGETEGLPLLGYGQGLRKATVWCSLVADDGAGGLLLGMRNNGIKYIEHPDGSQHLYDLGSDPGERDDVAGAQENTVEQAQRLLAGESAALGKILRER